ncbi:hypothetical protein ABH922_001085 [Rhodococcus sp. 27YEA15]|uniref:hypothetical protein n=1 Tax=Rhodococcus sp. 27YEA15 TaxID=3156259 RepID=UPI003C7ACFAB
MTDERMGIVASINYSRKSGSIFPFVPVYLEGELSFNIDNRAVARRPEYHMYGTSSILISYVEIEIDIKSGRPMFVSGYHPNHDWIRASAFPYGMIEGEIYVTADPEFEGGIPFSLWKYDEMETIYDSATGWVRMTRDDSKEDHDIWKFSVDAALGFRNDELHSLWVKPIFEQRNVEVTGTRL